MRYWVYINDKVDGPFEEDKLVSLPGFTPDTLICSEEIAEGGQQEWVKASSIFEFDEELQATFSRKPLTAEELNTALHDPAMAESAAQPHQPAALVQPAVSTFNDVSSLLLEKIDRLTQEVESLKEKLDAAISAAHTQAATPVQHVQESIYTEEPAEDPLGIHTITLTRKDMTAPVIQDEVTNTESLVSQAESLVAQASQEEASAADFLAAIPETASKPAAEHATEAPATPKEGEEVVLRSALDSLYNQKVETEEEKEATFQDLLTLHPFAKDTLRASVNTKSLEKALAETPVETSADQAEQDAAAQQRENIINEITAGAPKSDFITQAIEEAKQAEANDLAALPEAPAAEPEQPAEEPAAAPQLPSEEDFLAQPLASVEETPAPAAEEKPDLNFDLDAQAEQLSIKEVAKEEVHPQAYEFNEEIVAEAAAKQEEPAAQPAEQNFDLDAIPSLESANKPAMNALSEDNQPTETMQELVPGGKLEDRAKDAPLSQADLLDAFSGKQAQEQNPFADPVVEQQAAESAPQAEESAWPAAEEAPAAEQQPEFAQEAELPQPSVETVQPEAVSEPDQAEPVNPNELTEVQLQEGSTYLISDFIPPAETNAVPKELSGLQAVERKDLGGKVMGTSETVANVQESNRPKVTVEEGIEEVIPVHADSSDISVSKIILENTIKTKRGPGLDLKTVPMVKEPAQTERLDLSESELEDINAQHDLKMADVKSSGGATKTVLGALVAIVILAAIYLMLAYMQLLPAGINFIKSEPKTTAEDQAQVEEMLQPDQQAPAPVASAPVTGAQQPGATPMGADYDRSGSMPMAQQPMAAQQPAAAPVNPLKVVIGEVKAYPLPNGQTLQQLIETKHPGARALIEWTISRAVEPDNYSILVKVPPENPQGFKISYRFNYNAITRTLAPTISDSKNLLDSAR